MARGLNKEWELFGQRYRVAGAKVDKVDCKACHKQVSAAVNRLQSHLRICPVSSSASNSAASSTTSTAAAPQPPPDSLSAVIEHSIETEALGAEPPVKKQRQSPGGSEDELWLGPEAVAALSARRLEIEEKRLALEIKRDQREHARERLSLEILAAQAKREKLRAEKEAYEAKVVLALSRKQLREQGVSDEEIDRILPITGAVESTDSEAENDTAAAFRVLD
ncbi:unnamed protein product [Phytophthora fragariaefolia]|uniref:Unnamed protein product n=1 Tax=Phytophthora fragariaefolia TaxID=1490495 RepID=A0A9W6XNB3_9STRA|nr:unnamed protein product [Phytophthora fragariaefolia]